VVLGLFLFSSTLPTAEAELSSEILIFDLVDKADKATWMTGDPSSYKLYILRRLTLRPEWI